jgi:hypothetical protein
MKRSKSKHTRTGAESSQDQPLRWARAIRSFWEEERSELASGISRQISCVPSTKPDDRTFAKLADLAQVSAINIEKLRIGICYELNFSWGSDRKPPTAERVGSRKLALVQLRRSAKISRELSVILSNLDQQALAALFYVDNFRRNQAEKEEWQRKFAQDHPGEEPRTFPPRPEFPESKPYLNNFRKVTNELAELLAEAQFRLQTPPPTKRKGRPRHGAFSLILGGR